jgi:hypothetical protein
VLATVACLVYGAITIRWLSRSTGAPEGGVQRAATGVFPNPGA